MRNPIPAIKAEWSRMTPTQKAFAVTATVAVTAINPLYPLVYGATYVAYSSREDWGKDDK